MVRLNKAVRCLCSQSWKGFGRHHALFIQRSGLDSHSGSTLVRLVGAGGKACCASRDQSTIASCLSNLSVQLAALGDYQAAVDMAEDALARQRALNKQLNEQKREQGDGHRVHRRRLPAVMILAMTTLLRCGQWATSAFGSRSLAGTVKRIQWA